MTDVKRLLEQATPLPWRYWAHEDGRSALYPAGPSGPPPILTTPNAEEPNLALIVHAVNSLPAYEALAETVDRLDAAYESDAEGLDRDIEWEEAWSNVSAALSRLRGEK